MIAAYLIEPGRPAYQLDDLAAEYGVEVHPRAGGGGGDGRARPRAPGVRAASRPLMRDASARARAASSCTATIELPLTAVLGGDGGRGREDRHVPHGRDHGAARTTGSRSSRRGRYELAGEEFMLGSTQQVARILFEKLELTPGRKGKTGYSTDTRVLRTLRSEHAIVGVIEEWREYSKLLNTYLGPLPDADLGRDGRLHTTSTRPSPPPAGSRPRTRTSRRSRSAPSSVARSARPSSPSRATASSRPTTPRSSCASSRTSPASRSCVRRSRAGRTSTRRPRPRCSARTGDADEGRAQHGEDGQLRDHLRHLRLRALREPRDPARGGAGIHRHVPRALPAWCRTSSSGRSSRPSATAT